MSDGWKLKRYGSAVLQIGDAEGGAVRIAAENLISDLRNVLDIHTGENDPGTECIRIASLDASPELLSGEEKRALCDSAGAPYHEGYVIHVREDGQLVLAGTCRRGTIYAVYTFSEKVLGVSPWTFFADVPYRQKEEVSLPLGYLDADHPDVEYRGIFINDEEELEQWVQKNMGEPTIGVKTYEKIFTLLLRLRMNYIWPAMHVNSFNADPENGKLASRMGIVVGTSHCDMLMRSNNREWFPWLARKGYEGAEYDFSEEKNRKILIEYWTESVLQNRDNECCYTLGMRGIHDSGIEAKALSGLSGEALLDARKNLLSDILKAQEKILGENLSHPALKTFIPYKEVLELYDRGLEVPGDCTLIWVNDNYGYMRRFPNEKERKRPGGNGLYYHNSYWAAPGGSYLFLCSIPLAQTMNELRKSYENGIRKIWVTNFGAMKPLEMQIDFYSDYAFDTEKMNAEEDAPRMWLLSWLSSTFPELAEDERQKLAGVLISFDQVTNERKVEQMDEDAFSQSSYGDEAAYRLRRYESWSAFGNRLYDSLPRRSRDAFFELILMKLHAAYFTNAMYYWSARSRDCMESGRVSDAAGDTDLSLSYDHARKSMLYYYSHVMADGKWNGILTPEDYPPPRTAMHPACMPPLRKAEDHLVVTGEDPLVFSPGGAHALDLADAGEGTLHVDITLPDFLTCVSPKETTQGVLHLALSEETRILLAPREGRIKGEGVLAISCSETGETRNIEVHLEKDADPGILTLEAESAEEFSGSIRKIPGLGRDHGCLLEAEEAGAEAVYPFTLPGDCAPLLELHRFPSLNATGRIRFGIEVDGGWQGILESPSTDSHRGNWEENVRNGVEKLSLQLPQLKAGMHRILVTMLDRYGSFSRIVLYTRKRRENSLGFAAFDAMLPAKTDPERFAETFYGEEAAQCVPKEPERFLIPCPVRDSTALHDHTEPIPGFLSWHPGESWYDAGARILSLGARPFSVKNGRVRIETAAALSGSRYAGFLGAWSWCSTPARGGRGYGMLVRGPFRTFDIHSAPRLRFLIQGTGGTCTLWARIHVRDERSSRFTFAVDGIVIPMEEIYGAENGWCYASEQVWKWVPAARVELSPGAHQLEFLALAATLRVDALELVPEGEYPAVEGNG